MKEKMPDNFLPGDRLPGQKVKDRVITRDCSTSQMKDFSRTVYLKMVMPRKQVLRRSRNAKDVSNIDSNKNWRTS